MYLEIVTPEKQIYSGDVTYVKLPGSKGSFGVLKNHAPLISTLVAGEIKLTEDTGNEKIFEIQGGVAEILKNNIIILATG